MKHRERIEGYFRACSEGDADAVTSHFTPEAVIYDTNHAPLRGADAIGQFWSKICERWQGATWYVNSCISGADCAAIEWTMTGRKDGRTFTMRGSEHYRFVGGKIDEIRQYWTFDEARLDTGLVDFPYATDPGQPFINRDRDQ